jgi:hypothetical protein
MGEFLLEGVLAVVEGGHRSSLVCPKAWRRI